MANIPAIPWNGGIDRSQMAASPDPNTAYDIKNMDLSVHGKRTRGGIRSYYNYVTSGVVSPHNVRGVQLLQSITHGPCQYILPYIHGRDVLLLCVTNQGIYYRDIGGVQDIDNSAIGRVWDGLQFGRHALFSKRDTPTLGGTAIGGIYSWSGKGTPVEQVLTAPNGRFMRVHFNRLLIAGDPDDPIMWHASAPSNPFNWEYSSFNPDAGAYSADLPGSQSITGISPSHYTGFYISTKTSLHYINGRAPSEYNHRLVSDGMGNFGHRTMLNAHGAIYGWNDLSCYALNDTDREGGVAPTEIGRPIRSLYHEKVLRDPSRFYSAHDYANSRYITFMPHIQRDDYTIAMVYDYVYRRWWWYEFRQPIYSAAMWADGHDPLMLLGLQRSFVGYMQYGKLKDYAAAVSELDYNVRIATHDINIGDARSNARIERIGMALRADYATIVDINYRMHGSNFGIRRASIKLNTNLTRAKTMDGSFDLDNDILYEVNEVDLVDTLAGGEGRYIQMAIDGNASSVGAIEIYGLYAIGGGGSTLQ